MDRAQIEAMLKEQEAKLEQLKNVALQTQGAIGALKEALRRLDSQVAAEPQE